MGNTSSTVRAAGIPGANYVGCYTDLIGALNESRTLADAYLSSYDMSVEKCATTMHAYKYFGVEYANECFGANTIDPEAELKPASECDFECVGANSEACGAGYRINLYENTAPTTVLAPGQCSLIITSYIGITTVTVAVSTLTVTSSVMSGTRSSFPEESSLTSSIFSITGTATSTIASRSTPTSVPPAFTSSDSLYGPEFYLYSDVLGEYITHLGPGDTFLNYSIAPSTTFQFLGQSSIVLTNTTTRMSILRYHIPYYPQVSFDTHNDDPLSCAIATNGSLSCTVSGLSNFDFGSCELPLIIGTAQPSLVIGIHTEGITDGCLPIDLRAVAVTSIQPTIPSSTQSKSPYRFYLEGFDDANASQGYVLASGFLSKDPQQAFYFDDTALGLAGVVPPMLIATEGADPFGNPGGYGISTDVYGITTNVVKFFAPGTLSRPLSCSSTETNTLACHVGGSLSSLTICSDGHVTLFDPSVVPTSNCTSATFKLIVPSNVAPIPAQGNFPTASTTTSTMSGAISTMSSLPSGVLSEGFFLYSPNLESYITFDGGNGLYFTVFPSTTFQTTDGKIVISNSTQALNVDAYTIASQQADSIQVNDDTPLICTIDKGEQLICSAGGSSQFAACSAFPGENYSDRPGLVLSSGKVSGADCIYDIKVQVVPLASYHAQDAPANRFYIRPESSPLFLSASGALRTFPHAFYFNGSSVFAVGVVEPLGTFDQDYFQNAISAGRSPTVPLACNTGLNNTLTCEAKDGSKTLGLCKYQLPPSDGMAVIGRTGYEDTNTNEFLDCAPAVFSVVKPSDSM